MQYLLSDEIPKLRLDYITLTKTCYKLMKQIHTEIKTSAGIQYPHHGGEDTLQPLYPSMVLGILRDSKQKQGERARGRDSSQSPQLEAVARILQKYLDIRARVAAISKST